MNENSGGSTVVVAVVYHSASGRTKSLARAVARGASEIDGTVVHLLSVDDDDKSGEPMRILKILTTADAIIFGCPTYMGSASAQFKAFMDSTSAVWALQGWRDKIAAGFTHSAALSGDKLGTLTQLAVFAAQHGMIWVGLGLPPTYAGVESQTEDTNRLGSHLGAMAQSRPGAGAVPESDQKTATLLGRRVAKATHRWLRRPPRQSEIPRAPRHEAARGWAFPPPTRAPLPPGIQRANLREIVARPERFEHHLVVCASVDDAQLEITAASEPLYFAHINISDEYALTLQSGDELVDRFPLRTFLSDPASGEDVGRYNHRVGDLVLHPKGYLHWPGRLRPPYEPFDFPPGMRRTGLSLVYCASTPMPPTTKPPKSSSDRTDDIKAYVEPAPPMALASTRGEPGTMATIGRTSLRLIELPLEIAPEEGGWVVILEATGEAHFPGDIYRVAKGSKLQGDGIVRALVFASTAKSPDPVPSSWRTTPPPTFAPFEDQQRDPRAPEALEVAGLRIEASNDDPRSVIITAGEGQTEVPRYWLARMLFRVGLHALRLGYVETYGGFFVDDRGDSSAPVLVGVRAGVERHSISIPRLDAMTVIEKIYRAVAPPGYTERPA